MINYKEYIKIINDCLAISKIKNHLYGNESLKSFDSIGILAKIKDKICRIENMLNIKSNKSKEKIESDLKDIINYSVYYIMIKNNKL